MTGKLPFYAGSTARLYDELLVTMARSGDQRAANLLVRRWQPRLLRSARRYANDAGLAEQLAQDCWVGIWTGLPKLRDPSKFAPWAFTILRKKGADMIKAQVIERQIVSNNEPEAMPATQDDGIALAQAFAGLTPDHRLAAHLFFVEGLALCEIAHVQSVPIGTAKSRLFHARRQLKQALGDTYTQAIQGVAS
ncbi:hypothetical protein BPTFM16_01211 [Altererythrobacter insulae]|nr:hypothetical protein BPTFM16_01211 [Altererythrobacter insulae]